MGSSGDDEHNTGNPLLLLCAHALAPALLSSFVERDELSVALSCRFALDNWTIMQCEAPLAEQESWQSDVPVRSPALAAVHWFC